MKKLIAVVVALMMSGPVMADSIATVEGTDWAWAIIDEDVYLCFREKQHSSGEKKNRYTYPLVDRNAPKPPPNPYCYKAEMVD